MLRIAIVEDMDMDALKIETYIQQFEDQANIRFSLTRFRNAEIFLDQYKPIYDLVLMDIELAEMNGMEAANCLREIDPSIALIFITNLASYAVKGYEVDALDYMVKPITYPMFQLKMQKFLKFIEQNPDPTLNLNSKNGMRRLKILQILYVEVRGHQLIYHTENGNYKTRGSLRELEEILIPQHFCRCNNCYLVNLKHIYAVQDNMVLVGNDTLPISRPKKRAFMDKLTEYLGG